jgi:hypothetical protein
MLLFSALLMKTGYYN